ncbi:hypothetical protein COO60DRAFT_176363 [Scenedesmus sp. NREL 46B-D3]|nr:hypothetical protein COO60DRAFT_176363 [Scenedesmus sp. NREL 46B-D3]
MAFNGQQLQGHQMQQLMAAFADVRQQAKPQHLSNTLWAVATMGQQVPAAQLQQLLTAFVGVLQHAVPQEFSNTLWAVATMSQQMPAAQLQQLLDAFVGKLQQAKPQELSNTLWAVAAMGQQVHVHHLQQLLDAFWGMLQQVAPQAISNTLWAVATMGQQLSAQQLKQLLIAFVGMRHQAKPQHLSNMLWAVATMGQQVPAAQLQQLLTAFVGKLQQALPQDFSNTLWAVATMGQQMSSQQLQQLDDALAGTLQRASPQNVANTLWACAQLHFLPKRLLAAPGLAGLLQAGSAQGLANAAWACGQLGHRDEQLIGVVLTEVQQRLTAASSSSNTQDLCNTCWAVAVLDLQQHAAQVLQMAQACSSMWSSTTAEEKRQLWQVHTWLLDFQPAGAQGLQGSLTEQQLQQCRAAWDKALQQTARQSGSDFQLSVLAAVHRLPITWQQQPQMEQLSVGRDGVTTDGALLLDIAGRTASNVLVAVEADGPSHFRRPDGGLMGGTQYRNRALAVRGYRLVSVPWFEWAQLQGVKQQQQQQYLLRLFEQAGVLSPAAA